VNAAGVHVENCIAAARDLDSTEYGSEQPGDAQPQGGKSVTCNEAATQ
jgi:hypothetical protein